ncbi:MAG: hypothetical protein IJ932_04505 [Ruminococcus sp.]|nr:hypothetical protein [Ruminococcus sp.]
MVKRFLCITISVVVCSLVFFLIFVFSINNSVFIPKETNIDTTLTWFPEKSSFKDYKIDKDKIKFCYSIYFINYDNESCELSLGAKFEQSELDGWFSYVDNDDEFLCGLDENGQDKYVIFKPKEKKKVDFWFEGKYLGGVVNTKLSFPEIIPVLDYLDVY